MNTSPPMPTAVAAPATPVVAPTATPPQPGSADFVLMLTQLMSGANSSGAAVPITEQTLKSLGLADEVIAEDYAELAALLSLMLPQAADSAKLAGGNGQSIGGSIAAAISSSLASGKVSAGMALDSQLLTDLQSLEGAAGEAPDTLHTLPLTDAAGTRLAPAHEAAMASRPVHAPVGSAAWADEIGSRLTMMTEQGRQSASLRLSPEHLGPLEVRIAINEGQASVWFGAAHADTRAAIELALPRLRELFAEQGMSLADAGVFQEAPRDQPGKGPAAVLQGEAGAEEAAIAVQVRLGLVDAYA